MIKFHDQNPTEGNTKFATTYKRRMGVNRESSILFLPVTALFHPHSLRLQTARARARVWLDLEMTENQSEGKLIGDCVISRSNLCSTMDRVHGWRALRITMNQLYYKGPFAIYPLKVFWVGNGLREIRDCGLNHLLRQHTAYEDRARVSRKEKREVSREILSSQIFLKLWIFLFLSFLFFFFFRGGARK